MIPENKYFNDSDRIFYSDGYRLAQSAIQQGFSNETLFVAIETLYASIDGLNESIIAMAERQNTPVSCYKGCHWCCHQAVFANSYELHFLAGYIEKNFTAGERSDIVERTEAKYSVTSTQNEEEILKYKAPCPLLKNDSRSVYTARPMACRIYLSTKLETCMEF